MLDLEQILGRYFSGDGFDMIMTHGRVVAELALEVGQGLGLPGHELLFLEQAAMLHDIGVCRVNAPGIGMHGEAPYIAHGILGRAILEQEGLPLHAMVCERHIGVGLSLEDIERQGLPLPLRDMMPRTQFEEIICYADLFFSKTPGKLTRRKSAERVREKLAEFGADKVRIFDAWQLRFGVVL